jgi:hypothetical protein
MNRRSELSIVAPDASPEEAAAMIAALAQFMRSTPPVVIRQPTGRAGWARTALQEGVNRQPDEAPRWG